MVYRNTPFKKPYIQSAAGDAGGRFGRRLWLGGMLVSGGVAPSPRPSPTGGEGERLVGVVGAGGVVGAASAIEGNVGKTAGRFVMDHAYWGLAVYTTVANAGSEMQRQLAFFWLPNSPGSSVCQTRRFGLVCV